MNKLMYMAKHGTSINNYIIKQGELVEVTHINIEIGKGSNLTFKDMHKNTHTLDAKGFFKRFGYDMILT